jgi:NTE family protein
MTIKHLVIPGGGPIGIKALGVLQHLEKNGYWNINEIESIYATSAGSILALLIALKFEWEFVTDYIIKRPWHEAIQFNINQIFDAFSKKGLFDRKLIEIFFKPFFQARDLSIDITLSEFFDYSKVELHIFSLDVNSFEVFNISHTTHPDLPLLTAIQMTAAIPIIMAPVCIEDKCFVDGGVVCNYPMKYCIEDKKNIDEIFGINNNYSKSEINNIIKHDSTILEYMMNFINRLIANVSIKNKNETIMNELTYDTDGMSLSSIQTALYSQTIRQELFDSGIKSAEEFLKKCNEVR